MRRPVWRRGLGRPGTVPERTPTGACCKALADWRMAAQGAGFAGCQRAEALRRRGHRCFGCFPSPVLAINAASSKCCDTSAIPGRLVAPELRRLAEIAVCRISGAGRRTLVIGPSRAILPRDRREIEGLAMRPDHLWPISFAVHFMGVDSVIHVRWDVAAIRPRPPAGAAT